MDGSLKPIPKLRRAKKSEDTTSEVINITKLDSDEVEIQTKCTDQQLQVFIPLERVQLPVINLNKVDSDEEEKDMPPPDSQRSAISTSAPDEEVRAVAETLETLQRHQGTESLPESTGLSTPPGEVEHFEGRGLMDTI